MSGRTDNPSTKAVVSDVMTAGRAGAALLAGVLIGAPIASWVRGFVAGRSRFLAGVGLLGGGIVTVLAGWRARGLTKLIPLDLTGAAASIPMFISFAEVVGIPGFRVPVAAPAPVPTDVSAEGAAGSLGRGRMPGGAGSLSGGRMPGAAGVLGGGPMPGAGRNIITLPKRSTLRSVRR